MSRAINGMLRSYEQQIQTLSTIPGIKRRLAEVILAEIRPVMSRFKSARHLVSWAGMCRAIMKARASEAGRRQDAQR